MTSSPKILKISKDNKMNSLRELSNKRIYEDYVFIDLKIKVAKLSVNEVLKIQVLAKQRNTDELDGNANIRLLREIINMAVEDMKELTEEEFSNFPIDSLTKLSEHIMNLAGMGGGTADKAGK